MDPLIVTQAINVIYAVSMLAVLALGLGVIFGLLGVLNIAHGEFIMIGAYCAYVGRAGMALSRRGAVDTRGLRDGRRGGRADHDPPALSPPVRHFGRDLGPEFAVTEIRRSAVRSGLSQPDDPAARNSAGSSARNIRSTGSF